MVGNHCEVAAIAHENQTVVDSVVADKHDVTPVENAQSLIVIADRKENGYKLEDFVNISPLSTQDLSFSGSNKNRLSETITLKITVPAKKRCGIEPR